MTRRRSDREVAPSWAGSTHEQIGRVVARNPARKRASSCTTGLLPRIDPELVQHCSEGRLDIDFQFIMSVAPHVREYREQPETFRWREDGRLLRYTPDGLAGTTVGRFYFEIKPERLLTLDPDLGGKLPAIRVEAARRGASFEILTEQHIRKGTLLTNSIDVWSAAQSAEPSDVLRACARLRGCSFPLELGMIMRVLRGCGYRPAHTLIGLRLLAVDLTSTLDDGALVHRGAREWA